MSNGEVSAVFARAMFSAVRTLTQILRSWLVITLQRNTQAVLLVLKPLCFQVQVKSAGHVPVYRKQCGPKLPYSRQVKKYCNIKS